MLSVLALALAASIADAAPAFYLPERIYAAPEIELNVYFREVFGSVVPQNFAFEARCPKGRAELTRWCFTPEKADAGASYRLVVRAWNDDGLVAAATTTVEVASAPKDPSRRVTLALFGDSLTNCGFQDQVLKTMREAGYVGYEPVGARDPGGNRAKYDGYGGYTFKSFFTRYAVSEAEIANVQDEAERAQLLALGTPVKVVDASRSRLLKSPLVRIKNGQKVVDVKAWLDKVNGGVAPDIVVIELGVNSVFGYVGGPAELHARIRRELLPELKGFIARLREDMPNATYFICTLPVGTSQDGYGANYGASYSEVQERQTFFALNREYDAFVKSLGDPKVRLMPVGHAVDPFAGYIQSPRPLSARVPKPVVRQVNAVHLSKAGGLQMGDAIAAALMAYLKGTVGK